MSYQRIEVKGGAKLPLRWSGLGSRLCVDCRARKTQWREWAVREPVPAFLAHDVLSAGRDALRGHAEHHALCERCSRSTRHAAPGFVWLGSVLTQTQRGAA